MIQHSQPAPMRPDLDDEEGYVAPSPDDRWWDGDEWLRLGDYNLPGHGCTKKQPLSVGQRLAAILDRLLDEEAD